MWILTRRAQSSRRRRQVGEAQDAVGDLAGDGRFSGQTCGIIAGIVIICQYLFPLVSWLFERRGRIRTRVVEVAGIEGVGRAVMGLLRLWKSVDKAG